MKAMKIEDADRDSFSSLLGIIEQECHDKLDRENGLNLNLGLYITEWQKAIKMIKGLEHVTGETEGVHTVQPREEDAWGIFSMCINI